MKKNSTPKKDLPILTRLFTNVEFYPTKDKILAAIEVAGYASNQAVKLFDDLKKSNQIFYKKNSPKGYYLTQTKAIKRRQATPSKPKSRIKRIVTTWGISKYQDNVPLRKHIISDFGLPDEEISHTDGSDKIFSVEMVYPTKGLSFFYLPLEGDVPVDEVQIFKIMFQAPYSGRTEEGIVLNKSSMRDVFKSLGKENWLTAEQEPYWWMDYSGISFYIQRDLDEEIFPINESKFLAQTIVRISVPIGTFQDDNIKNEKGQLVQSAEDFCIDGGIHESIFDGERAERVCAKCGLVLSERMISIEFSGTRAFSKAEQDKRSTHGSPINPLVPDIQMATMIDKKAVMSESLRKAVKWDSRYSWKQRNMIQATSEIKRIGELLNLPNHVKIYAILLYRQSFQRGLLKGRSIRAMVAASIYYACGAEKVPRTLPNIVSVSDATFHQVTRCYQSLIKELKLSSPTLKPALLVSKYIAELNLSHEVEVLAHKILTRYEKRYSLSGKDPKGILSAALYLAAQYSSIKMSQTKISRTVGITEVTLRNRLREMQKLIRKPKPKKTSGKKIQL
jgi:transcription initiation factor TFIIB